CILLGAEQAGIHEAGSRRARDARRREPPRFKRESYPAPRRFRADGCGDRSRWRTRPGALLHLVSRAAKGFVLIGPARKKARRWIRSTVQEIPFRRGT